MDAVCFAWRLGYLAIFGTGYSFYTIPCIRCLIRECFPESCDLISEFCFYVHCNRQFPPGCHLSHWRLCAEFSGRQETTVFLGLVNWAKTSSKFIPKFQATLTQFQARGGKGNPRILRQPSESHPLPALGASHGHRNPRDPSQQRLRSKTIIVHVARWHATSRPLLEIFLALVWLFHPAPAYLYLCLFCQSLLI